MTKSEFTWSVLRLLGLVMFILGSYLVFSKMSWYRIGGDFRYALPIPPLILVSLGFYFLFFGRSVFGLLMREERKKHVGSEAPHRCPSEKPTNPETPLTRNETVEFEAPRRRPTQEPTDPKTTLTQNKTIEFEAWLQSRRDLKSRSKEDQIALYRDHQNAEHGEGGKASPCHHI
jgi:hypothetical protein